MTSSDPDPRWEGPDAILDSVRRDLSEPAPAAPERYEIRRKIGEGAMADVYEAFDRQLGRRVAVKKPKEFALADAQIRTRFEREARSSARLSHPNVVQVHDVATEGPSPFLVMEFIDGVPLNQHIRGKGLGFDAFLALMEKVARAVQYVHEQGVVHRDLKPGNILVTAEGEPKVADFGLAHWLDAEFRLTRSGTPLGTPLYMAPEQVDGRAGDVDPRTDVYALGSILYEGATGRPPHDAKTISSLYQLILSSDPAPARQIDSKLPADLDRILSQALAKDPGHRYASAGALADDIARLRRGDPVLAKPPGALRRTVRHLRRRQLPITITLLLAVAATVIVFGALRIRRHDGARRLMDVARANYDTASRFEYYKDPDLPAMRAMLDEALLRASEAERIAPELPEVHHLLGLILNLQGKSDLAEREWRRAISLDPDFALAHLDLGRLLLVDSHLALIIRKAPGDEDYSDERRRSKGKIAEALREFQASLGGRAPVRDELSLELARALLALSLDDAAEAVRICNDALPRFRKIPRGEEFLWIKAFPAPPAEARALLDEAIGLRPGYLFALLARCNVRMIAGDLEGAADDCSEILKRDPAFAFALHNRGIARLSQARYPEAVADFTAALAVNPKLLYSWAYRGKSLYLMGKFREALPDFDQALAIDPEYIEVLNLSATAHARMGEHEEALKIFDRVVRLEPADGRSHFNRGRCLLDLKRGDEAMEAFDKAIVRMPDWWKARVMRGQERFKREQWAGAAEDFERLLETAPKDWPERERFRKQLEVARRRTAEH